MASSKFKFSVPMQDGTSYTVQTLLAKGKDNLKTAKSEKEGVYKTSSLSLAPAKVSGFNLCSSASAACIAGCLHTSGNAMMFPRMIIPARIAKARMLRLFPEQFKQRLLTELRSHVKMAQKAGKRLCVRLNIVSDVMWEREMPELFTEFPDVQFYDYTKHYKRTLRFLQDKTFPRNYHLTFSWSGQNRDQCLTVLGAGGNVAVPFHLKKKDKLPTTFEGFNVVDGDLTDLRFLEGKQGIIVGLKAKGKARGDFDTGFVVSLESLMSSAKGGV
jgi:hypothetical protein